VTCASLTPPPPLSCNAPHADACDAQARELESKSQQLLLRTSSNNREQIMADLQQVKQENMALIQQLKQAK
jgi:hypothetical protein